jgi:sugar/nucleoside kinase (ribokinase family)
MSEYDVYGIGNALVDMEYSVEPGDLRALGIDKGVMTLVDADEQARFIERLAREPVHRSAGGSAANTVIAVSQLGGRGFYACKIADDALGHLYDADLRRNGITTNALAHSEAGDTGRCLVFVTPDADRTMCTYLGITGGLTRSEIVPEALRASTWLYIEGYLATSATARDAIAHARGIAEAAGVKTALSLSDPGIVAHFGDGLREMIGSGVDLLFANEAEALGISGSRNVEEAVVALTQVAPRFVITRGAKGALVHDHGRTTEIAAQPVDPVDTNGAGDMFAGAFLHGLTQGWTLAEAGELATRAAARLITAYGPRLEAATTRELLHTTV